MGSTPYHQTRQVEDSINERSIFILSVSAQLLPGEFEEVMETRPPRLMICSVEFLASEEVLLVTSRCKVILGFGNLNQHIVTYRSPWSWAHCKCAGLGNGSVCNLGIKWVVLIWPYISQMLLKIPDAPLLGNYPDAPGFFKQSQSVCSMILKLWLEQLNGFQFESLSKRGRIFTHVLIVPENRHSHIGCICVTFLHCAFSNVSSNCLLEKMPCRTGCICLIFLHDAFSNVFICSKFSTVRFQIRGALTRGVRDSSTYSV